MGTWLCVCEIWFWNKSIHTSRGSPPVSLDDDLQSPIASTDSLPVVNEFGWLFKGDAEKEDGEPSLAREAQDSLLCNRKWSSTSISITIAFSTRATESWAAFSASALESFGDNPSAATPAAAAAITWVCWKGKTGCRNYCRLLEKNESSE